MRAILIFLVALLLSACAHPAPAAPTREDQAVDLQSKTVALVIRNDEGHVRPYCSGVWASPTTILTAAHCVADDKIGDTLDYVTHGDVFAPGELHERTEVASHGATLYAVDEDHDLALLRANLDAPAHATAHVSLRTVRAGDFAQSMGHSLGLWWSYSSGDVAAVRAKEIGLDIVWIQATTPISPGNSGGGLFDARGDLIGLCSRGYNRGQNLNLFVHAQYLDALLRRQATL